MKKILVFFMLAVTLITYVQGVTISSSYISDITLDGVPAVIENTHGEERLFFAIDPDKGSAFTAILSCPGATQILFDGQNISTDNPVITVADYATGNHTLSVTREGIQRTWRLMFTTLPIICFDSDLEAMLAVRNSEDLYYQNPRKKTDGYIVIVDPLKRTDGEYVFSQNTKSRIRGAASGGYSKKSFTVSLYDDAYEDKVDATVLGMRDDDGWILDAMYADHARMRNRLLFDIWNDMDDLPYDKDSDKPFQANGTHGMHVEILFNGSYFGLYCLTDKIDRKQLNLKKSRTDFDGNYTLTVSNKNATLVFSFIGYKTQEIPVAGKAKVDVILQENAEQLDEVVVTGYGGSQKRATLTTSISKLDNAVLENAAMANAGQSLQGTVSGLRVVNISGQPGKDPNIVLRGGATMTGKDNGALVVVDGIVRNSLADINPSDIESIQVLKDAASTAIYGARANGGVILVTTKRGKEGVASVSYKFKGGANFARTGYDYLNAEDYIYYNRLGYKRTGRSGIDNQMGYGVGNDLFDIRYLDDTTKGLLNEGWQQMTDPNDPTKQLLFKDYSGQLKDAAFKDPSFTQDHYLNITGGNDKGTFAASLGYYKEDGLIKGTSYERFSGTLNGSYKIFPILTVNGGATYTWSRTPGLWIGQYEFFYRTMSQRPTWNPYMEDGSPASGFGTGDGNPLYYKDKLTNTNGIRRSTYNIGFDLQIIPEKLVLKANSALYHVDNQTDKFDKAYQQQNSSTPNLTRQAEAKYVKENQQQHSVTLTYSDSFKDKHNLEAMVGGEYFNWHQYTLNAKTQNSPSDDIPTLNAGSNRTYSYSYKQGYRILSGFARVNYNYNLKYLLSVVARYDGISKLSDHRWGFFPGVSAGWNIMEEDFFKDSKLADIISNLKPRVSYGVNGNVNGLGYYDVYGSYGQKDKDGNIITNYNNSVGFYNDQLVNSGLRWEQSKSFEVGLDIGFFNNRLSFILDYYNRTTSDLLTDLDLPNYTGFKSIKTNLGTLRNQGFEMEVKANILNNVGGFSWDVTANLSTVANKIIKLPANGNENNRQGGYQVWDPKKGEVVWVGGKQEGGKLGDLFAFKQDHIFKDWDDVKANANNRYDAIGELYGPAAWEALKDKTGKQQIEPGDVCWADLNGDGVINNLDRVKVGNIFPNVTGGFSTTVSYKDFSLYARFDYALGHTLYNDLAARSIGQYQGSFNIIDMVKQSWSEENTNTDIPKFYYADQLSKKNITRSNNGLTAVDNNSSRFYEKGDYLALREITLTWNLPKRWINKAFMSNASVYVTGQNLCYFTGYSGVSPEPAVDTYYGQGIDNGRYPTPKTVLMGVSVTF